MADSVDQALNPGLILTDGLLVKVISIPSRRGRSTLRVSIRTRRRGREKSGPATATDYSGSLRRFATDYFGFHFSISRQRWRRHARYRVPRPEGPRSEDGRIRPRGVMADPTVKVDSSGEDSGAGLPMPIKCFPRPVRSRLGLTCVHPDGATRPESSADCPESPHASMRRGRRRSRRRCRATGFSTSPVESRRAMKPTISPPGSATSDVTTAIAETIRSVSARAARAAITADSPARRPRRWIPSTSSPSSSSSRTSSPSRSIRTRSPPSRPSATWPPACIATSVRRPESRDRTAHISPRFPPMHFFRILQRLPFACNFFTVNPIRTVGMTGRNLAAPTAESLPTSHWLQSTYHRGTDSASPRSDASSGSSASVGPCFASNDELVRSHPISTYLDVH